MNTSILDKLRNAASQGHFYAKHILKSSQSTIQPNIQQIQHDRQAYFDEYSVQTDLDIQLLSNIQIFDPKQWGEVDQKLIYAHTMVIKFSWIHIADKDQSGVCATFHRLALDKHQQDFEQLS